MCPVFTVVGFLQYVTIEMYSLFIMVIFLPITTKCVHFSPREFIAPKRLRLLYFPRHIKLGYALSPVYLIKHFLAPFMTKLSIKHWKLDKCL